MRGVEGARSCLCAALRTTAFGFLAALLGAGGAGALPDLSFPANPTYSSLTIEASVAGFSDDQTVDLWGPVDTELFGILGPSPGLSFAGGTVYLGDVNFSIPGAALPIQVAALEVEAVLSGGPVWGTPVGGAGFEGEFELAGVSLTLNKGTVDSQVGTTALPTIDFSLAPVVFDLDASDTAWLSATELGGGLYDYILTLSFDGTQMVPLLPTLEVELSITGTLVGEAQAVPEPGTATLIGLGLAALALVRRSGDVVNL